MIQHLSFKLASALKVRVPDHPGSVDVMAYALSFILNTLSVILLSIFISLLTGRTTEAVIVLLAFSLLRQVSGGFHLKSGMLCILVSSAGVTAISLVPQLQSATVFTTTLIALVLTIVFAPSKIDQQTKIPKKFYPALKLLAALMVSTNLFLGSSVLAITFLVQALTLIRGRR